jgi:hypothetical protein
MERNFAVRWKPLHRVEASLNRRGKVACSHLAALRVDELFGTKTVFGTVAIEESATSPKLFRIVYDGITHDGKADRGSVELPPDDWRIDTIKAKTSSVRARLLLLRFVTGDFSEIQLTLPINNHIDSKRTKAIVDSLVVYGAHHISNKLVRVGKQTLVAD